MKWISSVILSSILISINGATSPQLQTSQALPSEHLVPPPTNHDATQTSQPSIMGRIAKWFGFGGSEPDSVISPNEPVPQNSQIQQRYYEVPPAQPQKAKGTCNPCNKVPWIPMVGDHHDQSAPILKRENFNSNYASQYQHSPSVQKLLYQQPPPLKSNPVHTHHYSYNYNPIPVQKYNRVPLQNNVQDQIPIPTYASGKLYPLRYSGPYEFMQPPQFISFNQEPVINVPIPVPNLSITPLPPVYAARPFYIRPIPNAVQETNGNLYTKKPIVQNSLPSLQNNQVSHQIASESLGSSAISNSDINIVKSISLGEFTSSVEYPPVQSPVIDLSETRQSAKDILSQPEYISEPIIVAEPSVHTGDSYGSASTHNVTVHEDPEAKESENIEVRSSGFTIRGPTTIPSTILPPFEENIHTTRGVDNEKTALRENGSNKNIKKDRETPKDLLDSPIYYLKKTSLVPFTSGPTSTVENQREKNKTTASSGITYGSWASTKLLNDYSHLSSPFTTRPTKTSSPNQINSSSLSPENSSTSLADKKSKQIQIIIPYTSGKNPRPFEKRLTNSFGWSDQSSKIDYHDSQESKIDSATVTVSYPPKKQTTRYLTKVRASNIRELLQKERHTSSDTVDISKLQRNIDGWTEQEFSILPNKASTISLAGQPKMIPTEYLTTPINRKLNETTNADEISTTTLEPYFADEAYKGFGELIDSNHLGQETSLATDRTPFFNNSIRNSGAFWDSLKLSISPITKEKVYVVTPQPWREYIITRQNHSTDFKSPRFSIRPTPKNGVTTSAEQKSTLPEKVNRLQTTSEEVLSKKYSPALFGSMEDSAFRPSTKVETIDGHSKVITIVTPPSFSEKTTALKTTLTTKS